MGSLAPKLLAVLPACAMSCLVISLVGCSGAPMMVSRASPLPTYRVAQIASPSRTTSPWSFCGDGLEGCSGPTPKTIASQPVPFKIGLRDTSAPVPAVPAIRLEPVRPVRIFSDASFAFDSAALGEAEIQSLESLGERLRALDHVEVKVVGHSDRIGALAHNQLLSQRRADTVAAYLRRYVPAATVKTEGRGPTDPVTGQSCAPSLPTAPLIRCLAPDRRVEVTVLGEPTSAAKP